MPKQNLLYGASGQVISAPGMRHLSKTSLNSGYDGASNGRRLQGWNPPSSSINAMLFSNLGLLRRRARDQVRNQPWMKRADRSYTANVIGNGIKPMPDTGDDGINAKIKEVWDIWVEECDPSGRLDFYGLQSLLCRSIYQSGEGLAQIVEYAPDRYDDLYVPLQIKAIESDHLDHTFNQELGDHRIIQAVEVDENERRAAYHVFKSHPGEMFGFQNRERVRIGARNMLHAFEVMRPGQVRGFPNLASALLRMLDMTEYEDAEIVRKKVAAELTFIIKSNLTEGSSAIDQEIMDSIKTLASDIDPEGGEALGPMVSKLESGTAIHLEPGEEVTLSESADVGSSYDPFMKMNLRAGAAGADVMYEQMTGDLTGVNFSSIRWGLNEMQRIWEQFQNQTINHQINNPVYRRVITTAVRDGVLDIPDFFKNPRKYLKVKWLAPGWPYVNPLQEAQADNLAIRGGVTSRSRVAAKRGMDPRALDQEIKADNERADELKLVFDSDPRKVNKSGAAQVGGVYEELSEDEKDD